MFHKVRSIYYFNIKKTILNLSYGWNHYVSKIHILKLFLLFIGMLLGTETFVGSSDHEVGSGALSKTPESPSFMWGHNEEAPSTSIKKSLTWYPQLDILDFTTEKQISFSIFSAVSMIVSTYRRSRNKESFHIHRVWLPSSSEIQKLETLINHFTDWSEGKGALRRLTCDYRCPDTMTRAHATDSFLPTLQMRYWIFSEELKIWKVAF